ncbi:MAG: AI-2E family transporter [Phycisphaerae bacterium]|nr:AI-2E family transporter [Phycisphaerae bacterium]
MLFDSSRPYTFDRVVRMVLTTLVALGLFLLLRYLSDVLVPFAVAAALAYFLNPLVTELEKRTKSRAFAVGYTFAGIFIVGMAMIVIAVPMVAHQFSRFDHDIRKLRADLTSALMPSPAPNLRASRAQNQPVSVTSEATSQPTSQSTTVAVKSTLGLQELWEGWADYLNDAESQPRSVRLERLLAHVEGTPVGTVLADAMEFVKTTEFRSLVLDLASRLAVGGITVINVFVELLLGATVIVVILLYLLFMLLDFPTYLATWKSFLPPDFRSDVIEFFREFEAVLRRYFRGQFVIAAISGVLYAVAFSMINLPMAVPFGLIIGLLTMVPYLPMIALIPGAMLAVMRSLGGDSSLISSFMWLGIAFAGVQIIQEGLIAPRVMGKATGLSPVAIILGLLICSKLLGFLGLILAIPITCLAITYYRKFVLRHVDVAAAATDDAESSTGAA